MDASKSFSLNLRKLRLAMRITQEALAHDAGTSSSYLSAIENGRSSPTLKAMERLAKALGVNAVYLLSGRISISIVSDDELEICAILARPAVTLRRHPHKPTGRPSKTK